VISSKNRNLALLVLAAVSLSFVGFAGPVAGAPTLDITGLRISPNPGYACENTTISFNVTNNLGTMADLVDVHVDAKGSAGGMSWQSNITMLADRATSFQSFTWTYPPEGTYDVAITVIGAGQIAQKSGIYTVLPCAAHIHIRSVTVVQSAVAPDSATLTVDVHNDGHAQANNTVVAVQATGPYPDATRHFLGSTVIPAIAAGGASHPDFMWSPMPASGVYTVTVMTIDETGVMMSHDVSLVVDLRPHPNVVQILGISLDPFPPMQGQESTVTAELLFTGNWTGVLVTVLAYADGPSSYKLHNITLKEVFVSGVMAVNFTWPANIEPGQYNLTVMASMFNPKEYTVSKIAVTQMARQKQWSPANFRLEIRGITIGPYPPLPGQNSTVTVEVANTGGADAPPAKVTVTAEGPAFYNLGTRTTPSTSFGTMVRMDFIWTQPTTPGEYIVRAFLEDSGGNQSDLKKTYVIPHVLEKSGTVVSGNNTYYYYNFGGANGTCDHNVTVTVRQTGNGSAAAAAGLDNPAVAGATGVAVGGVVSVVSVLAYAWASKRGYDYYKSRGALSGAQTNPMYEDKGHGGQSPMHEDRGARTWHGGVHPGSPPPEGQALVGGALPGGAVISSAVGSAVRESPTLASTGVVAPRDAASGLPTGKRQHGALDDDDDGDGAPDVQGMAINEKGLPGEKKPKKTGSHARTAGGGPVDDDSDDDGLSEGDARKGWDGTVKGSTKADEGEALGTKKGYDYYQAQSQLQSTGASNRLRESPTKASTGAAVADQPPELRESPTRASTATARDPGSGLATGRRSYEPAPADLDGDGAPDLARKGKAFEDMKDSDITVNEEGVRMAKEEGGRHTPFQNRVADHNSSRSNKSSSALDDSGSGGGETGPDAAAKEKDKAKGSGEGKKEWVGHVSLLK